MSRFFQFQNWRGGVFLLLLFPLFAGTLTPHPPIAFTNGTDVYAHWGGFFLIGISLLALLHRHIKPVLALLTALALSLEAAQAFIDSRTVSAGDALANLFGVFCAFALFKLLQMLWSWRNCSPGA